MLQIAFCLSILCHHATGYWDIGTTTMRGRRTDDTPRQAFFRWQWTSFPRWWFWNYDWVEIDRRRRLHSLAGMSIDMKCLTTAVILNRRCLLSAYNPYHRYMHRQQDIRIWALGRAGLHNTPYRYRVFLITRLFPWSGNEEHCHGPRCMHQPRHDVAVIICLDQMYLYPYYPQRYQYAYRAWMPSKYLTLAGEVWFGGSGYEYMEHVIENYKIFYSLIGRHDVVDCSKYIPKWWGKFICMRNTRNYAGVQNGGGLFTHENTVIGVGCFEIRMNDDRIFVFTDLRYYVTYLYYYTDIWPGWYYEYAYPQWGVKLFWIYDGRGNYPYIPVWQIMDDLYPMGR